MLEKDRIKKVEVNGERTENSGIGSGTAAYSLFDECSRSD